jgi:hypothetical protein
MVSRRFYNFKQTRFVRIFFCLCLFISALSSGGQKVVDVGKNNFSISPGNFFTIGENLVANVKYVKLVEGTPYFSENWMRGSVISSQGTRYDSILLRIDLFENELQYIDPKGNEMVATTPVRTVVLSDSITGKKYEFDHSAYINVTNKIEPGWYQLLSDGRAALYKRIVKSFNETRPYGSATIERRMTDEAQYFIFVNSVLTRIKKIKDIPQLLPDKRDELSKYIASKNLNSKSDTDFIGVMDHYNTISAK